ncbi:MAG: ribosome maturation factor RimP [Oscillospiraceae bacterium]|nr:ribosome maturation factor RimP [Oscillospiraceae bacterium]
MNRVEKNVWDLALPVVEQAGLELWDVEYVTEAGQKYLRVYLDGPEGVTLDDCETVSRALDPILDEKDPVPDSYIFEVSSAGCERSLKRPSDFQRFLGSKVEVRLYSAVDGSKLWVGTLTAYEDGAVTVDAGGQEHRFEEKQVANVRLRMEMDF